jgi:hypothetical protein
MRYLTLVLSVLLGCGVVPPGDAPLGDAAVPDDANRPVIAEDGAASATYESVRAIFQRSCSGYCHAGGSDVGASLVLAPRNGSPATLVNRPSRQVPRMMVVVPGDPGASYLIHKIEGTMGELPECAQGRERCGIPMPYAWRDGGPAVVMPREERDLIRRWIAAGAPGPSLP